MIQVSKMTPISPGNPYASDAFHIGTTIGKNVTIMYSNFPDDICNYIIVVNTDTGKRVKISFS